jgi:hypothetical protein
VTYKHDATGRLSLLAGCNDLVIAIAVDHVHQIFRAAEVSTRPVEKTMYAVDLDTGTIPGWDLGELLEMPPCTAAWVVLDVRIGTSPRRFGLRVGRCIAVQPLPPCYPLPRAIFTARRGALAAGFSTQPLAEFAEFPSGVVIDSARLWTPAEIEAGAKLSPKRTASHEAAIQD